MSDAAPLVLARDGYRCVACGATTDLTVDHIKPVSLFDQDDWDTAEPTEAEVEAAADALRADNCPHDDPDDCDCGDWTREARAALKAVRDAR